MERHFEKDLNELKERLLWMGSLAERSVHQSVHAVLDSDEELARRVLGDGLPRGTLLNVNIPPGPIRGLRVTRQGTKIIRPNIIEGTDPRQRKYYWIGEESLTWNEEAGTDYEALRHGLVSITPLRNDLTDYAALEEFKLHDWEAVLERHSK